MAVTNLSDYPQLQRALETRQKIVYLCGAGASMSLGNHRLSWVNWILAGKDYLSSADRAELDKRIGSWTSEELIDAATYLLDRLKAEDSYKSFMDTTIGSLNPANSVFTDALCTIWRTGDLIATTNYDLLIENSVGSAPISYATPSEILSIIRSDSDNKVIHLHGVYDKARGLDDIIADDPQYKGILANAGAQFIQNLISTHTIIIVGCGGTIDDPNLSGFMNFVVEELGATDVPYFYLMKNGDKVPLLPKNATPVFYGDNYTDLPVFLSDLALLRIKKRVGSPKLIAVNPYTVGSTATSAFARMHFSNEFSEFVGREKEIEELNGFLEQDTELSWWSLIGEGGIGKSRLVLEWLKKLPSHWFGFFTRKDVNEAESFEPFTDTVIVFDYILGNTHDCANMIGAFVKTFADSPYKLRLLFIERTQESDDWLEEIKGWLEADDRLSFEAGTYRPHLTIDTLPIEEEKQFAAKYLTAYLPIAESNAFIEECKTDIEGVSQTIDDAFRTSVEENCFRPLYLAIYIEVWLEKEGNLSLSSSEELMMEYLNKEKRRWKTILGDNALVDSYMRLFAVACAIELFNITDYNGNRYLEDDCRSLIEFFDNSSRKPGAKNEFPDLFVSMDELVENADDESILDIIFNSDSSEETAEDEGIVPALSLDDDDRFAFCTPYLKVDADPTEVYLQMLVDAGIAKNKEIEKLHTVRQERIEKVRSLPDHAWIIVPVLPTIIKEFIVSYVVNERDIVRFTKLARSNSVFGFHNFLSLALEDRPETLKFQKMIVTPPDEVLNYFEYYLSILICVESVKDFKPVEQAMIDTVPCFGKYEIELWKRIAHVLNDREDVLRLYDSGCKFIEYLESLDGLIHVKDEAADVIREYSVGLHNAEELEKYTDFLQRLSAVDSLFPKNVRFGSTFCECWSLLINLKLYLDIDADISEEWTGLQNILLHYEITDDQLGPAMKAADRYLHLLIGEEDIDRLYDLESCLEELLKKNSIIEVAEIAALTTVNIFTITIKKKHKVLIDKYEKIKVYFSKYSHSIKIRSTFLFASKEYYLESPKPKQVPEKLIKKAEKWARQYPEEIEFQEGYFELLYAKLLYAQKYGGRGEEIRIFKEMKKVAERTDYSEYDEDNEMLEALRSLETMYGY